MSGQLEQILCWVIVYASNVGALELTLVHMYEGLLLVRYITQSQ